MTKARRILADQTDQSDTASKSETATEPQLLLPQRHIDTENCIWLVVTRPRPLSKSVEGFDCF